MYDIKIRKHNYISYLWPAIRNNKLSSC